MAEIVGDCCLTQMVSSDGEFNSLDLRGFMNSTKLHECGVSYDVVAIMGPQSSGKSTLLNHLFHTNFREMNALQGRSQTTKGIWICKAEGIEPFTLVMDLEGTDGRERGQDDTAFEKQSALFALAVADIVLINMWCHDIGREQAANMPLLETVFKVMMQLFSSRKTTLLFVLRDKTETPIQYLEDILREDINKIWEAVPKPPQHEDTPLSDFFNVEVIALCNKKEEEFKEQVAELRHKYFHSPSPADRRGVVPASGFYSHAENIWKNIKENKDLDLPALKVLAAKTRCEEIADEKFNCLASSEDWVALKRAVETGQLSDFGRIGSSILNKCLSEYDLETTYYEEDVRKARREHLKSKALQLLKSWYIKVLTHLHSETFEYFKTELEMSVGRGEEFANSVDTCKQASMLMFHKGCSDATIEQEYWHASGAQLLQDIKDHASRVGDEKLSHVLDEFKNKVCEALCQPVEALFEAGDADTWASIRGLVRRKSDAAALELSSAIRGFALSRSRVERMVAELEEHAKVVVERKSREEARRVVLLMTNRFHAHFKAALAIGRNNKIAITREAQLECLKLLSTMAVLRLDEDSSDNVKGILIDELMNRNDVTPYRNMASTTWNQVPPEKTLITPVECHKLWRLFKAETEWRGNQAESAPESGFKKTLVVGGVVAACVGVGVAVAAVMGVPTTVSVVGAAVEAVVGAIVKVVGAAVEGHDGVAVARRLVVFLFAFAAAAKNSNTTRVAASEIIKTLLLH